MPSSSINTRSSSGPVSVKLTAAFPGVEQTPEFCKRVNTEEMNANSKLETQKSLVDIGRLMETSVPQQPELPKIKTMSLDELSNYVEQKLSKEHYSPEVIYLLFQIQSLLLEKSNTNNTLIANTTIISELKKDLIILKLKRMAKLIPKSDCLST